MTSHQDVFLRSYEKKKKVESETFYLLIQDLTNQPSGWFVPQTDVIETTDLVSSWLGRRTPRLPVSFTPTRLESDLRRSSLGSIVPPCLGGRDRAHRALKWVVGAMVTANARS